MVHDRFISGLRFNAAAKLVVQAASWLGTLYVLRVLDPRALGLFGIASAVLGYASMVYEGGLMEALVQRPPDGRTQRNAVFSLLLFSGVGLAAAMVLVSPLVARLVGDPQLAPLTMTLAAGLLLVPLGLISQSRLMNEMRWDLLAFISTAQAIVTTAVSVGLAFAGHGAWALVWGFVAGVGLRTLMLLLICPPGAGLTLQLHSARGYLGTGGVLVADGVLWRWYTSLDSLLLGRWAGTTALGQFSFGQQVSNMPLEKITTVVNDISLPAYVALEEKPQEARYFMLELIRTHAMIGFPMFWGLAAVAEPTILTIFGDKWLPATWCLTALSLIAPLRLIGSVETPAMTGIRRAGVLLKSKAVVVPVMTVALAAGAWLGGVDGVAWAWLLAFPPAYGLAFGFVLHAIGLTYGDLWRAIRGPLLAAAGMALAAWGATQAVGTSQPVFQLGAGILAGVLVYAALLWALDRDGLLTTVDRFAKLAGVSRFLPRRAAS